MNNTSKKVTLIVSLGSAIEYYDFVIYGMMSHFLSQVFFLDNDGLTSILLTLSIFAVGYVARPLGGTLAGFVGDMYGRRKVFLFLTGSMACSTLAIGFLPSYSSVGFLAAILLTVCRICQGISFGGELAGATTIVGEFTKRSKRSSKMSFILSSTAAGAISATFILYMLTELLTQEAILAWGWRIPFLIGGVLGIVLWVLRKNIVETPEYTQNSKDIQHNLRNFFMVLKENRFQLPLGIFLTCFNSSLVLVNLYFPFYISNILEGEVNLVYQAITISLVFSCLIFPVIGKFADKFSKINLALLTSCMYVLLNVPLFYLLEHHNLYTLIIYMIIHQLFIAAYSVCYFPLVFELFPVNVRYTSMAFCYNIVYALMGFLPVTLTFAIDRSHSPLVLPYVMSLLCMISLVALGWIKYQSKERQEREALNV